MNKLIPKRNFIRQNVLSVIGICLTVYFGYHLVQGERSLVRLMTLERAIVKTQEQADRESVKREALEARVTRLRPGSLDRDLLEERARIVLGFGMPDEQAVVLNN